LFLFLLITKTKTIRIISERNHHPRQAAGGGAAAPAAATAEPREIPGKTREMISTYFLNIRFI
jgi:hypothetical protein